MSAVTGKAEQIKALQARITELLLATTQALECEGAALEAACDKAQMLLTFAGGFIGDIRALQVKTKNTEKNHDQKSQN